MSASTLLGFLPEELALRAASPEMPPSDKGAYIKLIEMEAGADRKVILTADGCL